MSNAGPGMIDWLLYNYPELRQFAASIEPTVSASIVLFESGGGAGNPIEDVAVRRAEVSIVADALERGIRALSREGRAIYRMKYRAYMREGELCARLGCSRRSYYRKIALVRETIGLSIDALPPGVLAAFWRRVNNM